MLKRVLRFLSGWLSFLLLISPASYADSITTPTSVTSLSASWSGSDLSLQWSFDASASSNGNLIDFIMDFKVRDKSYRLRNFAINKSSSNQTFILTKQANTTLFGKFISTISSVTVTPENIYGKRGAPTTIFAPSSSTTLTAPTFRVTPSVKSYLVNLISPATLSSGVLVEVQEAISSAATAPSEASFKAVGRFGLTEFNIAAGDGLTRWVRARLTNQTGGTSAFSSAAQVQPQLSSNGATTRQDYPTVIANWSGDDIYIYMTLPVSLRLTRLRINLTSPNDRNGNFTCYLTTGVNQTCVIKKSDIFGQFVSYYSSFKGKLSYDSNYGYSSPFLFEVPQRGNPFYSIPDSSLVKVISGIYSYSVTPYFVSGATYFEIWEATNSSGPFTLVSRVASTDPVSFGGRSTNPYYIKFRWGDDYNLSDYSSVVTVTPKGAFG